MLAAEDMRSSLHVRSAPRRYEVRTRKVRQVSGGGTVVLGEALEQFESELTQLAWQLVRLILERELARRPKARPVKAVKTAKAAKAVKEPRRARAVAERKPAPTGRRRKAAPPQLELGLVPASAPAASPVAPAPASAAPGKRRKWTRDTVIEELATWMVNGTALDAQFLTRHGPPGLVAAARRIFGRFDAALNVAGLHFAKLYPDGPPVRKRGMPGPAAAAAPAPVASAAPEPTALPEPETSPE